ncbi:lactosylceramide 4-alpha-galactosyltransferase-like [Dermacentor variabilis]|uniref:lactosylceramide 4-alpha-galactosyltransferase-like n=1 Tax=Dermacentor variabilis TaxID=34621 RepID=UPI003F5B92C8
MAGHMQGRLKKCVDGTFPCYPRYSRVPGNARKGGSGSANTQVEHEEQRRGSCRCWSRIRRTGSVLHTGSRGEVVAKTNKSVNASYHIWFLETSTRRKLKARRACSVESACRHNSDFTVHLLSNGNISSSDCPYHDALSKIPNFRSAVLNASVILADTPLAPLQAKGGPLTRSRYATEHLSDFLRLAMLWIHGGIYIDLDVIVMKSLEGIRNTVFYESEQYNNLASTVLFFDKHHPALGALMDESARMYRPGTWRTVLEAVETLLSDAVFSRIVNIASSSAFLPVYYPGWKRLFDPKDAPDVLKTINGSYGVHFWNSISKGERVVPGSGCALDLLARAHCPRVYRLALSDGDLLCQRILCLLKDALTMILLLYSSGTAHSCSSTAHKDIQ